MLLIGSGQAGQPLRQIARRLQRYWQQHSGQIKTAADAAQSRLLLTELSQIAGVGRTTAARILACYELGRRRYQSSLLQLSKAEQVWLHCSNLRYKKQEYCLAFFLNGWDELLGKKIVAIGGLNYNFLELRAIFERAFQLEAASFILVHNHPSGLVSPSDDDLRVTAKVAAIAEQLGVKFLDHLIIGGEKFLSLRAEFQDLFGQQ